MHFLQSLVLHRAINIGLDKRSMSTDGPSMSAPSWPTSWPRLPFCRLQAGVNGVKAGGRLSRGISLRPGGGLRLEWAGTQRGNSGKTWKDRRQEQMQLTFFIFFPFHLVFAWRRQERLARRSYVKPIIVCDIHFLMASSEDPYLPLGSFNMMGQNRLLVTLKPW